jgi:hypothetical protein
MATEYDRLTPSCIVALVPIGESGTVTVHPKTFTEAGLRLVYAKKVQLNERAATMLQWLCNSPDLQVEAGKSGSLVGDPIHLPPNIDWFAVHLLDPGSFQEGGALESEGLRVHQAALPDVATWGHGATARWLVDMLFNNNAVHFLNHHRLESLDMFRSTLSAINAYRKSASSDSNVLPAAFTSVLYGEMTPSVTPRMRQHGQVVAYPLADGLIATEEDVLVDPRLHIRLGQMTFAASQIAVRAGR